MDIWGLVDQTYTTVLFKVRTLTVDTVGHIEIQSHESDVWQIATVRYFAVLNDRTFDLDTTVRRRRLGKICFLVNSLFYGFLEKAFVIVKTYRYDQLATS
jgi:hypothetical protein